MSRKLLIGLVVVSGTAAGLYSQGLPPFASSPSGHAASREAAQPVTKGKARDEPAPTVTVVRAAKAPIRETTLVTGTLVARLEVLVAPEIEGLRVVELLVDEGDRVTVGQPLARLEQATLDTQLVQNDAARAKADAAIAQAKSNIVAAEARRQETGNAWDRARPLGKTGVLSDSTLDQREAAARTAEAQLKVALDGLKVAEAERAQIDAQRRDIDWRKTRTELRAPVGGVVSRRSARIGAVASGSAVAQPMFHIIANGEIELEAEVPEADLARLKSGQEAALRFAGSGEVKGIVRLVSPEVDKSTRLGRVRIAVDSSAGFRIGSFGRGTVLVREAEALVLPSSAVLFGPEGAYVQLVVDNRIVTRRIVAGLHTSDIVEIRSGLVAGDPVAARSGTFLRHGDLVSPVEPRIGAIKVN